MKYRSLEQSIADHLDAKINNSPTRAAIIMKRPQTAMEMRDGYALPVVVVNYLSTKARSPETLDLITQRLELSFVIQIRCISLDLIESAYNKVMRYLTGFRASYGVDPMGNAIQTEKMYFSSDELWRDEQSNIFIQHVEFIASLYIQEEYKEDTTPIITTVTFLENGI